MVQVLYAFNGQVNIEDYARSSKEEILKLFNSIRDHPDQYKVQLSARESLLRVVQHIQDLVVPPSPRPKQWTPLILLEDLRSKYPTETFQYNYALHGFRFDTLFDLVGWIFSVCAVKHGKEAKRENFYWPLAGLYSYFCRTLSESNQRQPQVIQMTWFQYKGSGEFVLVVGGNLDNLKPARKTPVRNRRADQMMTGNLIHEGDRDRSYVNDAEGTGGQLFGHCAETFPFLFLALIYQQIDAWGAQGFAAQSIFILGKKVEEHYQYDPSVFKQTGTLILPCANCNVLITDSLRLKPDNFSVP